MINTRVIKLSTKRKRGTIKVSDILKVNKKLQHFESVCEEEKEMYRKTIKECKEKLKNLNITEEMRNKKVSELTEEEKDKLYDEYIYNGLIKSSISVIKYGTCDIKYFLEEIEQEREVTRFQ